MRKFTVVALAAAAVSFPAVAHAGGYAQVQTGIDSVSVLGDSDEGVAYGLAVGYDFPLNETVFAGIELSADDSSTKECGGGICVKTGRDLSAVARLGTKLGEKSEIYVLAGYTNARLKVTGFGGGNGDGLRAGAGYKLNFSDKLFAKVEYRYSNYESDFSRHNGLVAVGLNF